jgi:enediyne biosynthesis protein E4
MEPRQRHQPHKEMKQMRGIKPTEGFGKRDTVNGLKRSSKRAVVILCGFLFHLGFLLLLTRCTNPITKSADALFSALDSVQTNIRFVNELSDTGELNILDYLYYYNGAGVAAGDVDNNGSPDLYFVSNLGENKLYINKGSHDNAFSFKDATLKAAVKGKADFQTGVSMADVNGDGWLDIYVCAVSGFKGLKGSNELYINNGIDANGDVTFTERASEYGLDFSGFSTQAVFFDYDKDSDLDMFLLNHAVHTSRSYEPAAKRTIRDPQAGDYLFENQLVSSKEDDGTNATKFKDVTQFAGIFQASMGYGLGVSVGDFNNDGWDDIYVGNDFHEDDYYYVNNHNGTFTESLKDHFGHVSRFSMGCDAADINNDGYLDLMTLDMYPSDETVEKSSAGEDPFDIFLFKLQYGYYYQYSRNCLQLNNEGKAFSDVGIMAGVAATDWSWSTLIADYDNDGWKDIFVTNGIVRRPNDLDYIKFISNNAKRWTSDNVRELDKQAIELMPRGQVHNYFYKGTGRIRFEDKSLSWGFEKPTISNGAAYVDLDNDGDLDIVCNNINEPASLYRNESDRLFKNSFLKIRLKGEGQNTAGIGAKVILRNNGLTLFQQLMPVRGFMSSSEPVLNFGLGNVSEIDSVIVIWSDGTIQIKRDVPVNETIQMDEREAKSYKGDSGGLFFAKAIPAVEDVSDVYSLNHKHQENVYYDFYKESLIPFQLSTEGPQLAIGDVNGDHLDDFYVGGARGQAGKLFIQRSGNVFSSWESKAFEMDSVFEDNDAAFFDADNDRDLDLYVVSGGNEFEANSPYLADRLYLNDGVGNFHRELRALPTMYGNKSCVRPCDFDKDGDTDLFVGGRSLSDQYGLSPNSYLLINNGAGMFSNGTDEFAPELRKQGMITDAQWFDWDNDDKQDLIIVGDWMPILIFKNEHFKLREVKDVEGLEHSNGFWQTIEATDLDNDGDMDFLVGNLGTNSKLLKNENAALRLYVKDVDRNGDLDHILAYQLDDKWYPAASKDELGKQLPFLKKKFNDYQAFAGKSMGEIFERQELEDALVLTVNTCSSVWLENAGNARFKMHHLPEEAQMTKIFAFYNDDLDDDGDSDVLLGGNFYGASAYQGRYDASYGLMLENLGKGNLRSLKSSESGFFVSGEVRDLKSLNDGKLLLAARNGSTLKIFRRTESSENTAQKGL